MKSSSIRSRGFRSQKRRSFFGNLADAARAMRPRALRVERLEERTVLSTIAWANRGAAGDNFDAVFGAGAPADQARAVIDAAIDSWEQVVVNFNHASGIGPPDINLTLSMNPAGTGCGASAGTSFGADGKPTGGNISIGICDTDGNGTSDWFVDPTPNDSSEFLGTITNAFALDAQAGSPAAGLGDLYTVALLEMTHVMGITGVGGASNRFLTGGFNTNTGIADDAEGGGVCGPFQLFEGPSINALLTNYDSGACDFGQPVHTAGPRAGNAPLVFGGKTVYGSEDSGNAIYEFGRRYLTSNKDALILKDAFDYDIVMPETFGTAYSIVNDASGALTVRGGGDNVVVNNVNLGPSNDVITIVRDGDKIVVSVDIGNDVAGTGPGLNATDQQDAFVTIYDAGQVTSIVVNAGGGNDSVTIGDGLGIPITVNGEAGNDTLIGGDIVLVGGPGDDYLYGSNGPDTLDGGAGNDQLYGLDGDDTLTGGNDDDLIIAGKGKNTIIQGVGDGNDIVDLSENAVAINYTITAGNDTVIGTPFDDIVIGSTGNNRIEGRGGRDGIDGGGGSDQLLGGDDSDVLVVSAGSATVDGGGGQDVFSFRDTSGAFEIRREGFFNPPAAHVVGPTNSATLYDVEDVHIVPPALDAASSVLVRDLTGTSVQTVHLNEAVFAIGGAALVNNFTGSITVEGSGADDTIHVADSNSFGTTPIPTVYMPWGLVGIADLAVGFTSLTLSGLTGNDTIKVESSASLGTTQIVLNGGVGDDSLSADATLNGGDGNDTLVGGAGNDTMDGGDGDDTFIGNGGTDTVAGGAGGDTILVEGTDGSETISLALVGAEGDLQVTVGASVTTYTDAGAAGINGAGLEHVRVLGKAGSDTFNITPLATMSVFVDGGDPIGVIPGDTINVSGVIAFFAGPEVDEGGFVTSGQPVSFDHIERFGSISPPAGCPFLIVGTNADDDITIIARDASTHAGADGVQDFTFSINGGPELLVLNAPDLYIDAGSGDDDIVIRAPAPNDEDWDVNVRVAGGPPSIGEPNEADRLVLETPGEDSIVFNPTGADTGNIVVDEDGDLVYTAGSTDSIITIGSFVVVCDDPVGDPIEFTYTSSPGGVELVEYDGELFTGSADLIRINNATNFDSTTTVEAGSVGVGSYVSGFSPLFNFRFFEKLSISSALAARDHVILNGTDSAGVLSDNVTSDADTVSFAAGVDVTLLAGIDQLTINTFDGDDNINLDLTLTPLKKVIDAGAGNDIVDLSGSVDADIFGGIGNDTLIGTPAADNIFGGAGNDVIIGGGGVDHEYGEDGNDRFGDPAAGDPVANDPGNDFMFGGDGVDRFVWDPGDGSDNISGGDDGADILEFHGSAAAEAFFLVAAAASPTHFNLILGGATVDTHGVEQVVLNTLGGADTVDILDLFTTEIRSINMDIGVADAAADTVNVFGRQVSDSVAIRQRATDLVEIIGLAYDIRIAGPEPVAGPGGDRLFFFGDGGNDTVVSDDALIAEYDPEDVIIHGNLGDDFISGFGELRGDSGDDTLIGGVFANQIFGDGGNDTIRGGSGVDLLFGGTGEDTFLHDFDGSVDTYSGDSDFDTILVAGTSGNDIISAFQTAAGSLTTTLNGLSETDTLALDVGVRTVERLKIEAGSGDDVIFVQHADALGTDASVNALLFDIDGGAAQTRDRLSVQDNGTGDLLLYRKAESDSAGSISVGPGNAESLENVFTNVEFIQPLAAAGGQLLVFKHDPFENNDERINATHLGADETINVDPNIDPGPLTSGIPDGFQPLPGDQDWYRIVAEKTGTLDIQVYFTMIANVASGRPGLPNGGNLDVELYDADGTLIVDGVGGGVTPEFGLNDANNDERIRIPAVEGQTYFLRVFGVTTAINNYNITVVNTPAPTPFDLELDDIIATSSVAGGISFTPADQRFNGGAALPAVNDFFNGKDVYFTEGNLNGQRGRVVDYIGATRTFIFAPNTFSTALGPLAVGNDFQIESVDTGRSQLDNVTRDNTPTIFIRVADSALLNDIPDNDGNPGSPPDETIVIPFVASTADNAPSPGFRVAVFRTENNTHTHVGYAQPVAGSPGVYSFTFASAIPDGSNFISARVEMIDPALAEQAQGFGAFAQSLEIVVDTAPPPVFFGLPNDADDGLLPGSDTGVNTNPETLNDLVTSDTTPGFFGQAEADAVIRLFIDAPQAGFPTGNGIFEPAIDFQIGFDVAKPYDGTNQYPTGYWQVDEVNVNLNAPPFDPIDGLRRIFVTAEDVAGNINPGAGQVVQEFEIFIDTQGPQITDVEINNVGNPYDLFDPKPSNDGPTPLVQSIVLSIQDLPLRTLEFLVPAIKADIAENPGHYLLTGDYNGIIPIQEVIVTLLPVVAGEPARATIELVFWQFGADGTPFTLDDVGGPLPDDRFTLFVNDEGIIDRAGNILDGESNADEPHDQDAPVPEILGVDGVPTGDGLPGGDFLARFTIDTRPEVGTWGAGSAWIDTNGNTSFDPTNEDFTNRDITYILGFTSDDLFAGNFALDADDTADGFDKLAAYGRVNGVWRWIVDTDNDGVPNVNQPDPAGINGLPVAGNFDGNATNGDEVGVFTGTTWWFDTDHDFQVDTSLVVAANFVGYPVVGDFDGDGLDDLAAWTDDRFKFDLAADGLDGAIDTQFRFGFPGANERPVAADVNQDGFDDIGLFVPNRAGVSPDESAEWYILVSGEVQNNGDLRPGDVVAEATLGPSILDRIVIDPIDGQQIVRFTPVPFGEDIYVQYGDEFSMPILGNFDPPVTPASADDLPSSGNNTRDPLDVNNDGTVSAIDALLVINHLNRHGSTAVVQGVFAKAPFLDVNNNGQISASDALQVINDLNARASQSLGGAEGEADEFFSSQTGSGGSEPADDDVLALLANDLENQRRKG